MKKLLIFLLLLFLFVVSTVVVNAQTGSGYALTWWTVDSGGAQNFGGGGCTLSGTAGQPNPGKAIGGGYELSDGYWGGAFPVGYRNYLPSMFR